MKITTFLLLLFFNVFAGFSQVIPVKDEANATIYDEFNKFFKDEIKHQGIKGNWIFRLNEITSFNRFDFNKDGLNDVLIEFNAIPIEGEGILNYYAVLLENVENKRFKYFDYLESHAIVFSNFEGPALNFRTRNSNNSYSNLISFRIGASKIEKIE